MEGMTSAPQPEAQLQPNPEAEPQALPETQDHLPAEIPPETEPARRSWVRRHFRLTAILALAAVILLLLIVPPYIGISRYKKHITELVSQSLGRPVRLSSVELRLLPRPGFVLTNLTVEADADYGAEPVLHATTVVAYLRLLSLWEGKLALDRIDVDEASLNLVRMSNGRWNVDSLLRTAGPNARAARGNKQPLPYMEATDSRINIKLGAEKLPFSLVNTDVSLWQEDGAWHVRLRGQPVRTDVALDQADTGEVRLEATLHPAPALSRMPIHADLDWREAQLGQLSRLVLGSDEGWRGNMTGEMHVDGTADAAQVTARLQASGVHREEFEPASLLDFDATCAFLYHYQARGAENIACNSPVGSGRVRLTGDLPAAPGNPRLTLDLDRVPAQAPLDLLRTLRDNMAASLAADGSLSGEMTYAPAAANAGSLPAKRKARRKTKPAAANPLSGSFTAARIRLSGEGLSAPVEIAGFVLQPAPPQPGQPPAIQSPSLEASLAIPAGAPAPLDVTAELARSGFIVEVRGAAALGRLRELARAAGIAQAGVPAQLSGAPAQVDLRIEGPWLTPVLAAPEAGAKKLSGAVTLRDANWKPDFLAVPVDIASATLRFAGGVARWNPVEFSYGPASGAVKGTATLEMPLDCTEMCTPRFTLHFAALDAEKLQAALLGAQEQGTLLSTLLRRFQSAPVWPDADGTVRADNFTAGPFVFSAASANLHVGQPGAELSGFKARALGGTVEGSGELTAGDKPAYKIEAEFAGVNPALAGALAGIKARGGSVRGSVKLDLAGFTQDDLASSAKGTLSFDWRGGTISAPGQDAAQLARFDRWVAEAEIGGSALTLGQSRVRRGAKTSNAEGSVRFGAAPKFLFTSAQPQAASR